MTLPELPRCAVCRVAIKVDEIFVFRVDGRAEHRTCSTVICEVCSQAIVPGSRIRRLEEAVIIHEYCWLRRLKASRTAMPGPLPLQADEVIAGGSDEAPTC
jgi:hypothetical protein